MLANYWGGKRNIGLLHLTWHFTSMSKKTSSPSGCSAFASRRLYREGVWGVSVPGDGAGGRKKVSVLMPGGGFTGEEWKSQFCLSISLPCEWAWSVLEVEGVQGGLEVLRRKPGKWLMLTRWSSRRRAWELASSSRKWPGSWNGVSHSKIAGKPQRVCDRWA